MARSTTWHGSFGIVRKDSGDITVHLPHSCDEWVIAESKDIEQVVTDLKEFLAEGTAALEELEPQGTITVSREDLRLVLGGWCIHEDYPESGDAFERLFDLTEVANDHGGQS